MPEDKTELNHEEISSFINEIPDEVLSQIKMSTPWQYGAGDNSDGFDADGATITNGQKEDAPITRKSLQEEGWKKFAENPQVNTSIRGIMGRIAGWGFESTSGIFDLQEKIYDIEKDPRNRLYTFWPKYVGRLNVEGELFLLLTLHNDGFVEVDFVDPSCIVDGGSDDSGIIFHPSKTTMPLFYIIRTKETGQKEEVQIPSIFIARYPELVAEAKKNPDFNIDTQSGSQSSNRKFKKLGGYSRFIVSIDKGLITKRAVAYLRTTLKWINYYENLKKYEIDWKKSSGAYAWVFKIESPKDYKLWLNLSPEDKRKTGIMAKKTPGGSLILPPGISVDIINPSLTKITDQDNDILDMVASGLNETGDNLMGTNRATYASTKASKGPINDRTSDEIAYFDNFLKYDFWSSVFFLMSSVSNFPKTFKVREAVTYDKNGEAVFRNIPRKPEQLIDIAYPVSENINLEERTKALLGVKHASMSDTLGIPRTEIARKLGFGGYVRNRLRKSTEDENLPELVLTLDAESIQESVEAEPSRKQQGENQKKKEGKDNAEK